MDMTAYKAQMGKAIAHLESELKGLQVGRASAGLVENIDVETPYGAMKVPQVGHVTVIDAQTIKIEPRDKTQTKYIEKAVYDSASGLTPQNEGDYIYIKIPALTEERRKQIAKQVKEMGEDIKARVRMTRQDAMKETKKSFDDKEIGEDEHKRNEKEIDALVKDMNMSIDQLTHNKAEEVMKV